MFSNEMNLRNPRATDPGTQMNAAHVQLLEKLRPIAFVETCQFLTIQSLEFQEIWPKTTKITKIASVKILLKQCLQKGFHVNS